MDFFIATKNAHKINEFSAIFKSLGIGLLSERDLKNPLPDVIENGLTFEENALIKARIAAKITGLATISDDSGLCVDYLSGAPGIHSARYAGENADSNMNNSKLLSELEGVDLPHRLAKFVCTIACVFPDGREFTVRGECDGYIDTKLNGNGGFGYDPLFISKYGCFGTISAEEKNKISHRAQAIIKFKAKIQEYLGENNNA